MLCTVLCMVCSEKQFTVTRLTRRVNYNWEDATQVHSRLDASPCREALLVPSAVRIATESVVSSRWARPLIFMFVSYNTTAERALNIRQQRGERALRGVWVLLCSSYGYSSKQHVTNCQELHVLALKHERDSCSSSIRALVWPCWEDYIMLLKHNWLHLIQGWGIIYFPLLHSLFPA